MAVHWRFLFSLTFTQAVCLGPIFLFPANAQSTEDLSPAACGHESINTYATLEDIDDDGFYTDVDCDDKNPNIYPGATELCNGVNDRCAHEGCDDIEADADQDGFPICVGDDANHPLVGGDCDDSDSTRYPGATEFPNEQDDNCDYRIDEGTKYYDDDGDGFPEEFPDSPVTLDCNDHDASIYLHAVEVPDGVDNDCDGLIDDNTALFDDDLDGYVEAEFDLAGSPLPNGGDCFDDDRFTYRGATELDDCTDNDCDGTIEQYEDYAWNSALGCSGSCPTSQPSSAGFGWTLVPALLASIRWKSWNKNIKRRREESSYPNKWRSNSITTVVSAFVGLSLLLNGQVDAGEDISHISSVPLGPVLVFASDHDLQAREADRNAAARLLKQESIADIEDWLASDSSTVSLASLHALMEEAEYFFHSALNGIVVESSVSAEANAIQARIAELRTQRASVKMKMFVATDRRKSLDGTTSKAAGELVQAAEEVQSTEEAFNVAHYTLLVSSRFVRDEGLEVCPEAIELILPSEFATRPDSTLDVNRCLTLLSHYKEWRQAIDAERQAFHALQRAKNEQDSAKDREIMQNSQWEQSDLEIRQLALVMEELDNKLDQVKGELSLLRSIERQPRGMARKADLLNAERLFKEALEGFLNVVEPVETSDLWKLNVRIGAIQMLIGNPDWETWFRQAASVSWPSDKFTQQVVPEFLFQTYRATYDEVWYQQPHPELRFRGAAEALLITVDGHMVDRTQPWKVPVPAGTHRVELRSDLPGNIVQVITTALQDEGMTVDMTPSPCADWRTIESQVASIFAAGNDEAATAKALASCLDSFGRPIHFVRVDWSGSEQESSRAPQLQSMYYDPAYGQLVNRVSWYWGGEEDPRQALSGHGRPAHTSQNAKAARSRRHNKIVSLIRLRTGTGVGTVLESKPAIEANIGTRFVGSGTYSWLVAGADASIIYVSDPLRYGPADVRHLLFRPEVAFGGMLLEHHAIPYLMAGGYLVPRTDFGGLFRLGTLLRRPRVELDISIQARYGIRGLSGDGTLNLMVPWNKFAGIFRLSNK